MSREIWRKRRDIDQARREKMQDVMREYDNDVYRPAIEALVATCKAAGHSAGSTHDNGLGWVFVHCSACHGLISKHGPDGQTVTP